VPLEHREHKAQLVQWDCQGNKARWELLDLKDASVLPDYRERLEILVRVDLLGLLGQQDQMAQKVIQAQRDQSE
jgi:hypothetical protein